MPPNKSIYPAYFSPKAAVVHRMVRLRTKSMRLVPDKRNNHAVEIEEEHQEVEAELDERFLNNIS